MSDCEGETRERTEMNRENSLSRLNRGERDKRRQR